MRYSDYVITRDDFPSVCPCEHYWIPCTALRRTRQRCAEALGTIVAIFSTSRYNGRRNLTVHVSSPSGAPTSPSFSSRAKTAASRLFLRFLDTQQPHSQLSASFPASPFPLLQGRFCTTTYYSLLLSVCHPPPDFSAATSKQSLRFPCIQLSLLSISVGVAQHGLVVGGLGLVYLLFLRLEPFIFLFLFFAGPAPHARFESSMASFPPSLLPLTPPACGLFLG